MSLSSQSNGVKKILPDLWSTLGRIQQTLGVEDKAMADMMRLTAKDFFSLKMSRQEPSARSTIALAEAVNISFNSIVLNKIDYTAMSKQFYGDKFYIPEKYINAAYGRLRIAVDYLARMEKILGWRSRLQLMRHLQVSEAALSNPDSFINMHLTVDIINWVYNQYRDNNVLFNMGVGVVQSQREGPIGKAVESARNIKELYEMLFGGILERYWERNFIWKVSKLDASCVCIRGIPTSGIIDQLGSEFLKTPAPCVLRRGILSTLPAFLGYPLGEVLETSCIAHGAQYCEFTLDLSALIVKGKHLRVIQ